MIKNLVVNGCSYTEDRSRKSWAVHVKERFTIENYKNLATAAAGNFYIANSTLDYLESADLNPSETLVIIMWSGSGRKDIRISGEWYYHFNDKYQWGAKSYNDNESEYYLFSGGLTNAWAGLPEIKSIFEWAYKLSDPISLCKDTLTSILFLENYLRNHNYHYRYASFVNYWQDQCESNQFTGDYSIPFFLKDIPMYQKFNFDPWVFADSERNCLGEFAQKLNEMDSTVHPTTLGHQRFSEDVIIPHLINSYAMLLEPRS